MSLQAVARARIYTELTRRGWSVKRLSREIGVAGQTVINALNGTSALKFDPGRLKGKGTRPRTLTLTPEANAAFALMEKTGAFGPFDTSSLNRLWKRAAKKNGVIGPTLYALRHSAGTAFYAATGDIQATANLLGHADIRQTRRYALAAQDGRADVALAAFRKQVGARKLAAKLAVSEKPKK